jgi:hypothetical protein
VGPLDVPSNGNVLAAGTIGRHFKKEICVEEKETVDAFYSLTDKF